MQSSAYDQIQGFEYWNTEKWKSFIEENVSPLYEATSRFIKFREFLTTVSSGKLLSEVNKEFLPFFLGGVEENGEYKKNSLAKLVLQSLGIYVDTKAWRELERTGVDALSYIKVAIDEKNSFVTFVKELNSITEQILRLTFGEVREVEDISKKIVENPGELLEIIKTIYTKCLQVSVNHNYYTFFAFSTRSLPYMYLIAAYPKIKDNFDQIKNFLGLEVLFEPSISEEKLRKDCTIWTHSSNGLCDLLYKLNYTIWNNIATDQSRAVFSYVATSLRDLKNEFRELVKSKVEWPPKGLEPLYLNQLLYLRIDGLLITKYAFPVSEIRLSFLKFLEKVSPGLFLGLAEIKLESEYWTLLYDGNYARFR